MEQLILDYLQPFIDNWKGQAKREMCLVAAFTIFAAAIHILYPQQLLAFYSTELWENTDHMLRVIANLVAFHDRSVVRNMAFNTVRCMANETDGYLLFDDSKTFLLYLGRVLGVWVMTGFFQLRVGKQWFLDHPRLYQFLMIFYCTGFGIGVVSGISAIEMQHGSCLRNTTLYCISMFSHYAIGDYLEDLIYGDLGVLGGVWHNWATYGAPLFVVFEIFVINHLVSPHQHGAMRDP